MHVSVWINTLTHMCTHTLSKTRLKLKKYIYCYFQNQQSPTIPRSGVWRASDFVTSGNLKSWIILNLDRYVREDALRWVLRWEVEVPCSDYSRELWDRMWNIRTKWEGFVIRLQLLMCTMIMFNRQNKYFSSDDFLKFCLVILLS